MIHDLLHNQLLSFLLNFFSPGYVNNSNTTNKNNVCVCVCTGRKWFAHVDDARPLTSLLFGTLFIYCCCRECAFLCTEFVKIYKAVDSKCAIKVQKIAQSNKYIYIYK